ncbi:MAG: class I SAM-dependent methyltransferase, partial [Myxococcota bacterium]
MQMLELGIVPDPLIRFGIRRICERRLKENRRAGHEAKEAHVAALRASAVAERPDAANVQHYEVPAGFFDAVLGPRLKYSCCTWSEGARNLAEAETAALRQVADRAGLSDGQNILELGCGWGSLSLYMAETYPDARITAVSNSVGQREFIEARALRQGLNNLSVVTADVNRLALDDRFD